MPSVSDKQEKTMRAVAHGWKPPASSGIKIPLAVAQEFYQADRRKAGRLEAMQYRGKDRRRER